MAETTRQMLTANRLRDGDVVYWRGGGWVETFGEGDVFAGKAEAEAALEAARKFVADNVVVNPYLFEVQADGTPVKEREIIRAAGPTVRHDLGKQARGLTPEQVLRAAAARDAVAVEDHSKERDDNVSI
ncbi:MAG: DUF2849 domain-containing protein [Alphaproteobacteria bacterium]|nr:DUF2849 domain-containing protein [Alphaproteobacteria bacterium]